MEIDPDGNRGGEYSCKPCLTGNLRLSRAINGFGDGATERNGWAENPNRVVVTMTLLLTCFSMICVLRCDTNCINASPR